jgi:hypothetical protein
MQPYNYTINTGDSGEAFSQGFNRTIGMGITSAEFQKAQKLADAQQIANEQAMQKRADFEAVANNPSFASVQKMMIKYPELSEQFKRSLDSMDAKRKESTLTGAFSVVQALEKGNTESAIQLLDNSIAAAKNSGDSDSLFRFESMKTMVEGNPKAAILALHGTLFGGMGGDKYAEAVSKLNKDTREAESQPLTMKKLASETDEAASKAVTAAAKAKFAESDAAIDLQKKGWDITKIQEDIKISKMNSQIAAMNAQTSRINAGTSAQGNTLKAQENALKLQEMIDKRNDAVRGKAAEVEAARFNIDNMLNTADRVLKTPKSVISSAAGPISSRIPTLSSDTSDFESLVETLGSQAFLSQLPNIKGMGQLSNTEGDKLQAALQNMSLKQSPERLVENVKEAQRLLLKVRKSVAARSGMPDTVPDTPSAVPSGGNIDALLKKYGQ